MLDLMDEKAPKLYLTGSRFFGTATEMSDWDFFTGVSMETYVWLKDKKFEAIPFGSDGEGNYSKLDRNTMEVWRLLYHGQTQIDIQLVHDVALKIRVQEAIKASGLIFRDLPRQRRTALWNTMFDLAQGITSSIPLMPPKIEKMVKPIPAKRAISFSETMDDEDVPF
jgi:hypothetical protein